MVWSDGLTGTHLQIAASTVSSLRVLAGPGTGKTYDLMRRVARFLEERNLPSQILVVTFTRTAARDLIRQLANLGVPGGSLVRAGTLHALCLSVLHSAGALQATGRVPRPLLKFEEEFLLADLPFRGIRAKRTKVRALGSAWATLQSQQPGWPVDPEDRAFHMASLDWLRFHQAMLMGEVVPETLRYLQGGTGVQSRWRWRHCLVDEYQDLNKAEQVLVDTLAEGATITVIGDPNQSIYGQLKDAHPEGILEFETSHPGTETHFLTECRRCPRRIVDLANNLISRNPRLVTSSLCACPGVAAGRVHVVEWDRPEEEATGLARFIKWYLETQGVSPGQVLALSPRRQIGYALRDELQALGVAAHSYFHEEALESDEAKERFSALSLAANTQERVALRCWLGLGCRAVSPAAYRRLREHCESSGDTCLHAVRRMASGSLTLPYLAQVPQRAQELLAELARLGSLDGKNLVDAWVPDGQDDTAELRRLSLKVVGDGNPTAEQLLGELREVIIRPEPRSEQDASVAIMSLHKSKGLTANLVVVAGCVDGLIPTIDRRLTISEQDGALEEQRRLFYVALTRSTDCVVMSYPLFFPRAVAHHIGVQFTPRGPLAQTARSPFIRDLGPGCPQILRGEDWLSSLGV